MIRAACLGEVGLLVLVGLLSLPPARAADGFIGCHAVREDASGEARVVASELADRRFVPASVAKLFVSAAALELLGADHRLETEIVADGVIDDRRLAGDLVVHAVGDPTWTRPFVDSARQPLDRLATQVAHSLHSVDGNLVIDVSRYPGRGTSTDRAVADLAFAFGARTAAWAIDGGALDLRVAPGEKIGDPIRASLRASDGLFGRRSPPVTLRVEAMTVTAERAGRGTLDVRAAPDGRTLWLVGEYPLGEPAYDLEAAAPDAARWAGEVLRAALERAGVAIAGEVVIRRARAPRPMDQQGAAGRRLAVLRSPPLERVLPEILTESNNWQAEMLLRRLALAQTGEGRDDLGLDLVHAFLRERVGIEATEVSLVDGSGLSPQNLVTPRAVVELLRFARRALWRRSFVSALAAPGSGTLESWHGLPSSTRAKTGSLRRRLGLAGLASSPRGPLVFACLVNHSSEPRALQRQAIADRLRRWVAAP
ncbi:MAG: D-alanyl-D-alanine carboxypeptidase/D-alanyl-D-alanine-endopeptidase [Acidobacteriota bacterium]